eukprot:Platyproteum_vivax@DN8513_c0_g1_i1.p1
MSAGYLSFNPATKHNQAPFVPEASDEDLRNDLPLQDKWAVWEQIMLADNVKMNYDNQTKMFAEFSTVQQFWKLWNHMPQPSELLEQKRMVREATETDTMSLIDGIMVFRDGVKPKWEDEANANGGHFQFIFRPSTGGPQIDEFWNNLVLGIIGGTIEPAHMINGVRLVDKLSNTRNQPSIRIEVWFSNFDSAERAFLRKSVETAMITRLDGTSSIGIPRCEEKSHKSK